MRLALSVSAALWAGIAIAEPSISFDRFTGTTKIVAFTAEHEGQPNLMFLAVLENHRLRELSMSINSHTDEWRYLKCRSTAWLINGKKTSFGTPEYDGDVAYKGVYEHFYYSLPRATLNRMSIADSIEFKACYDEVSLDDDDLAQIQDFAIALDAETGVGRAPRKAK